MDNIIYILVTLFATLIGSISGMGGGVIIKPVFDMFGAYSAFEISVLTSTTMLAMSIVSVGSGVKNFKEEKECGKTIFFVAAGSLFGGYIGDAIFNLLTDSLNDETVKTVQNTVLLVLVLLIIIYMRSSQKSLKVKSALAGLPVGLLLGIISAFLGIGGGSINVAVLTLVFGFNIKTAVLCSLTSVLVAQSTKVITILIHNGTSAFALKLLPFIVIAGVIGAIIGRTINKKASEKTVNTLFVSIQFIVVLMCTINIVRYIVW